MMKGDPRVRRSNHASAFGMRTMTLWGLNDHSDTTATMQRQSNETGWVAHDRTLFVRFYIIPYHVVVLP